MHESNKMRGGGEMIVLEGTKGMRIECSHSEREWESRGYQIGVDKGESGQYWVAQRTEKLRHNARK